MRERKKVKGYQRITRANKLYSLSSKENGWLDGDGWLSGLSRHTIPTRVGRAKNS